MSTTYAQRQTTAQKKDASSASSVLDASSQSESLQRKADMANSAAQRTEAPRPNNTGMPDNLKSGIESLSGFSMDDVRVHYNSSKPATVQALAYTQGSDIHVAPGQEKHLPHEAWHVAQQMAGRVSPITNINGMPVNDNTALEHEADVMGEKAVNNKYDTGALSFQSISTNCLLKKTRVLQMKQRYPFYDENGFECLSDESVLSPTKDDKGVLPPTELDGWIKEVGTYKWSSTRSGYLWYMNSERNMWYLFGGKTSELLSREEWVKKHQEWAKTKSAKLGLEIELDRSADQCNRFFINQPTTHQPTEEKQNIPEPPLNIPKPPLNIPKPPLNIPKPPSLPSPTEKSQPNKTATLANQNVTMESDPLQKVRECIIGAKNYIFNAYIDVIQTKINDAETELGYAETELGYAETELGDAEKELGYAEKIPNTETDAINKVREKIKEVREKIEKVKTEMATRDAKEAIKGIEETDESVDKTFTPLPPPYPRKKDDIPQESVPSEKKDDIPQETSGYIDKNGRIREETFKAKQIFSIADGLVDVTFDTNTQYDSGANDLVIELVFNSKEIPLEDDMISIGENLVYEIQNLSYEKINVMKNRKIEELKNKLKDSAFEGDRKQIAEQIYAFEKIEHKTPSSTPLNIKSFGIHVTVACPLAAVNEYLHSDLEIEPSEQDFNANEVKAFFKLLKQINGYDNPQDDPKSMMRIMNRTSFGQIFSMMGEKTQEYVVENFSDFNLSFGYGPEESSTPTRKSSKLVTADDLHLFLIKKFLKDHQKQDDILRNKLKEFVKKIAERKLIRPNEDQIIDEMIRLMNMETIDPTITANRHGKYGISALENKTEDGCPIFEFRGSFNTKSPNSLEELPLFLQNIAQEFKKKDHVS